MVGSLGEMGQAGVWYCWAIIRMEFLLVPALSAYPCGAMAPHRSSALSRMLMQSLLTIG